MEGIYFGSLCLAWDVGDSMMEGCISSSLLDSCSYTAVRLLGVLDYGEFCTLGIWACGKIIR